MDDLSDLPTEVLTAMRNELEGSSRGNAVECLAAMACVLLKRMFDAELANRAKAAQEKAKASGK